MLDPDLQNELKEATTTAAILHGAMLFEPVVLVVMAVVLGKTSILEGARGLTPDTGFGTHAFFIGLSALSFGLFFLFRSSMLTPEKLTPIGADTKTVVGNYKRAHIVPNVFAVAPAVLGLASYVMTGEMTFLVVCAAMGVAMMMMTFPRHETLVAAVEARLARDETLETEN